MTGQELFDRYVDAGAFVAVDLVNRLARVPSGDGASLDASGVVAEALAVDPPSVARLAPCDTAGFIELARRLSAVFAALEGYGLDAAAADLNNLLARHPAHPHLAKEEGRWRLHHHLADVDLVPMWTSICAENLARIIGAGQSTRLGSCAAPRCANVFLDESKNASRRFCSNACNNRERSAAYRRRHTS